MIIAKRKFLLLRVGKGFKVSYLDIKLHFASKQKIQGKIYGTGKYGKEQHKE